jgi:hypothetical protein
MSTAIRAFHRLCVVEQHFTDAGFGEKIRHAAAD